MRHSNSLRWDNGSFGRRPNLPSALYKVRINPLLQPAEIPVGFRSLDDVLDEFVDAETELRLKEKRKSSDKFLKDNSELKKLRLNAGLSQKELAQIIGTSQPRLSQWESGLSSPSVDNLRALKKCLGIDFNTLMKALPDAAD